MNNNILLANLEIAQKRFTLYSNAYDKANSASLRKHTKQALHLATLQLYDAQKAIKQGDK